MTQGPGDVAAWLRERVGHDVTVGELTSPSSGFSNDTLLTTADWGEGPREIVLRLAPEGRGLFPRYDLSAQAAVLLALRAHSDVPVPDVLWNEPDAAPLGRPFFVMSRVPGRIPPDGHIFGGWVKELPVGGPARACSTGCSTCWRASTVSTCAPPASTPCSTARSSARRRSSRSSATGGRISTGRPTANASRRSRPPTTWCAEHRPSERDVAPSLVWGDARLGNLVIDDELRPAAVLDWEMAVVGPPELDLGWVLFLDRTALQYGEQLPGFLDRAGLVAEYERRLGRPCTTSTGTKPGAASAPPASKSASPKPPEARDRNPVTKALRSMLDL